jgi:hypothetical protein
MSLLPLVQTKVRQVSLYARAFLGTRTSATGTAIARTAEKGEIAKISQKCYQVDRHFAIQGDNQEQEEKP